MMLAKEPEGLQLPPAPKMILAKERPGPRRRGVATLPGPAAHGSKEGGRAENKLDTDSYAHGEELPGPEGDLSKEAKSPAFGPWPYRIVKPEPNRTPARSYLPTPGGLKKKG